MVYIYIYIYVCIQVVPGGHKPPFSKISYGKSQYNNTRVYSGCVKLSVLTVTTYVTSVLI